jgi:hypothetical protein
MFCFLPTSPSKQKKTIEVHVILHINHRPLPVEFSAQFTFLGEVDERGKTFSCDGAFGAILEERTGHIDPAYRQVSPVYRFRLYVFLEYFFF